MRIGGCLISKDVERILSLSREQNQCSNKAATKLECEQSMHIFLVCTIQFGVLSGLVNAYMYLPYTKASFSGEADVLGFAEEGFDRHKRKVTRCSRQASRGGESNTVRYI